MNPVETDTEIARLAMAAVKPQSTVERQLRYRDGGDSYLAHHFDEAALDAAVNEVAILRAKQDALEATYTGWSRYFHVTNVNGHVHDSTGCSSCFHDTQFAWRTDLSGLTPEEVVAREAYNACSVCMPIAPVEQRAARERYNAEQRAARADEKQVKADAKLLKAAERAVKFLTKVDAAVVKHCGSWDAFWADYSLYGKDGRKSVYELDVPSQVGDYLYDEKAAQEAREGGTRAFSRHMKDPKVIVAEARERGLIA